MVAMMNCVKSEFSENKERIMDRSTTNCRIWHKWTLTYLLHLTIPSHYFLMHCNASLFTFSF